MKMYFKALLIAGIFFVSMAAIAGPNTTLDLKFTSDPNSVNFTGGGVVPMVMFGNEQTMFDTSDILLVRIEWNAVPVSEYRINSGDENGDGFTDIKIFVKKKWLKTVIAATATDITVAVHTSQSVWIGEDFIRIVKY
jgi:hypothetical protein